MARRGTIAMLAVGAACLLAAAVGAYADHAILDERAFADRAAQALDSDELLDEVAARLADGVIAEHPGLAGGPATIEDAIRAGVTEEGTFAAAFRTGAARLHRGLFRSADAPAELTVPGSGAAMRAALAERVPLLERRLPRVEDPSLLAVRGSGPEGALRALAPPARDIAGTLTVLLAVAGLTLLGIGIACARDRRRAARGAALAVAAAGGLIAAGVTVAHEGLMTRFTSAYGDSVVTAIWDAFLTDLRRWALVAGAVALVAALALARPRPVLPRIPARRRVARRSPA